jgi:hypothetical protein
MPRFRSRPVEVEAIEWSGVNEEVLKSFTRGNFNALDLEDREQCDDPEATGQLFERRGMWQLVYTGDWIVEENGQFYKCRPEAFAAQFDAIDDTAGCDLSYKALVSPVVAAYRETATALANASRASSGPRKALLSRLNALQECGDRNARYLGVSAPPWDDLLALAGVTL